MKLEIAEQVLDGDADHATDGHLGAEEPSALNPVEEVDVTGPADALDEAVEGVVRDVGESAVLLVPAVADNGGNAG